MLIKDVKAIDVHAHFGEYIDPRSKIINKLVSADIDFVLACQKKANAAFTVVSPMEAFATPDVCDPVKANDEASAIADSIAEVFQWIVVHPGFERTFAQAEERLKTPKCLGIKIHPEMHNYHIKEHGKRLIEFAAKHGAVVLTHSGQENSKPEDFLEFTDACPEMTLIVAHLGCTYDDDPFHQVYAVEQSKHGNVYLDTSSASGITPRLLETAVNMIGSDKMLYGSDVSCYFSPMQRARIDNAFISDEDKKKILYGNAMKLFSKIPYVES
jgi:predicted TIM-barrel fold metal-dependent hydrolase